MPEHYGPFGRPPGPDEPDDVDEIEREHRAASTEWHGRDRRRRRRDINWGWFWAAVLFLVALALAGLYLTKQPPTRMVSVPAPAVIRTVTALASTVTKTRTVTAAPSTVTNTVTATATPAPVAAPAPAPAPAPAATVASSFTSSDVCQHFGLGTRVIGVNQEAPNSVTCSDGAPYSVDQYCLDEYDQNWAARYENDGDWTCALSLGLRFLAYMSPNRVPWLGLELGLGAIIWLRVRF
jgi:hypothetical protein